MRQNILKMWGTALFIVVLVISVVNLSFIGDPSGKPIGELDTDLQWEFFEQQLLLPDQAEQLYGTGEKIQFPHNFAEHYGTAKMYGTYVAKVKLPKIETGQSLAVYIPYQYGSYRLYVNGNVVARNGTVGSTKNEQIPEMAPKIGQLHVSDEEVVLTLQLSNFYSATGGFLIEPYVGEFKTLVNTHNTAIMFRFFITGIVVIASLFALLYGWFNYRNQQLILFTLFSTALAVRGLFARPYIYSITIVDVSWEMAVKLEMFATLVAISIALRCIYQYYVPTLNRLILQLFQLIFVIQLVLIVLLEPILSQTSFNYVFAIAVVYLVYIYVVALRNRKALTVTYAVNYIGTLVVLLSAIYDFIIVKLLMDSSTIILYSLVVYVMMVCCLISWQFAQRQKSEQQLKLELIELNASLDFKIKERTEQLEETNKTLAKLAKIDALTGIGNRYTFDEQLEQAYENRDASHLQLGLILIDIDDFKKYNDYYGHIGGDKLIQHVVHIIAEQLPENVSFARYGGEEFAVICPHIEASDFIHLGNRIVDTVAAYRLEHKQHPLGYVTISVGGYLVDNDESCLSERELIRIADERLYKAKNRGKNCFVYKD